VYHPRFFSDRWDRLVRLSGLPPIRLHDGRHEAASLALAADVAPKAVQAMLGHSSMRITTETYRTVLPEMHAATASASLNLITAYRKKERKKAEKRRRRRNPRSRLRSRPMVGHEQDDVLRGRQFHRQHAQQRTVPQVEGAQGGAGEDGPRFGAPVRDTDRCDLDRCPVRLQHTPLRYARLVVDAGAQGFVLPTSAWTAPRSAEVSNAPENRTLGDVLRPLGHLLVQDPTVFLPGGQGDVVGLRGRLGHTSSALHRVEAGPGGAQRA
jgi:hypothetical protein